MRCCDLHLWKKQFISYVFLCLALVQDLYKDVDLKIFSQLSTVDIVTVGFNLFECKH